MEPQPVRGRNRKTSGRQRQQNPKTPGPDRRAQWDQAALFTLFFLSGISGLVYETVWLRILIRILGNTTYATSVVLAAFMAGMALGSYAIGRFASGVKNQLRLYAMLEFGVGISAVALTAVLLHSTPFYRMVYEWIEGNRFGLTLVQSLMALALLLAPTALMGGTLPVLSAHTKTSSIGFAPRIGLLYGMNTLGAVLGVLGAGFFTIGLWGETATLLIGVGITVAVALLALALSARTPAASATGRMPTSQPTSPTVPDASISPYPPAMRRLVGLAYLLSGFVAMSYEIVWTRMFQIQVGTSIYAFSTMLAFYLAGIGAGSLVGGRLLGRTKLPLCVFGAAQLAIALYSVLGLYLCLPFEPVSFNTGLVMVNILVLPLVVVFPITFVLGAMFPLVCRCYVASEHDVSRAVGRLYSLNTVGCIAGSLICGFLFISLFGTRGTVLVLAVANALIGLVVLLWEPGAKTLWRKPEFSVGYVLVLIVAALAAPDPFMAAVNRAAKKTGIDLAKPHLYYHKESVTATTTAMGNADDHRSVRLWVNGICMTTLCVETKIMAHLPLLLHPAPRKVLVICFGMGTTVRSVSRHSGIECDAVELVPEVIDCFKYFHADAAKVLADPRIRCHVDDGRNYLLMRPTLYDVITIDPAPPLWSAGTVNLYSKEFFELCKSRLTENGILCLWLPFDATDQVQLVFKTFHTVFENAYAWALPPDQVSGGAFLIGFRNPGTPAPKGLRHTKDEQAILADLNEQDELGYSLDAIWKGLMTMNPTKITAFAGDARVITDDHPYTEFPLWRDLGKSAPHDPMSR